MRQGVPQKPVKTPQKTFVQPYRRVCVCEVTMEAMTLTLWTLTLWTLTLLLTYAMRLAGWFGLPVLLFFSMLTCYTAKLLGKILEHVPSKKLRDGAGAYTIYGFHDMGELVFGEYGKILISVIFVLETFGYCCVYLIIEGENLEHQLRYHPWFQGWGKAEFMSMSALIFLPSCLLRNLSWLSYFSALGVFSSMCLLIGVLATGLLPDTPPAPGLSQSRPRPEF